MTLTWQSRSQFERTHKGPEPENDPGEVILIVQRGMRDPGKKSKDGAGVRRQTQFIFVKSTDHVLISENIDHM